MIGFRNEWQKEGGVGSLNEFINKRSNIRFSIPTSPEAERERQFGKNLFGISMEAMRQQSKQFETGEMERVRLDYGEELFNRVGGTTAIDTRIHEGGAEKGRGVRAVLSALALLGRPRALVAAVGDGDNDVSLLLAADRRFVIRRADGTCHASLRALPGVEYAPTPGIDGWRDVWRQLTGIQEA